MKNSFSIMWRIRTTSEFRKIYSEHQFLSGLYYVLYFQSNNLGYPRLGVVASRKSLKKAVIRNRVRRIVKEDFRLHKFRLPSIDMVFIAKSISTGSSKKELHECVHILLNQLIMQSEGSLLR